MGVRTPRGPACADSIDASGCGPLKGQHSSFVALIHSVSHLVVGRAGKALLNREHTHSHPGSLVCWVAIRRYSSLGLSGRGYARSTLGRSDFGYSWCRGARGHPARNGPPGALRSRRSARRHRSLSAPSETNIGSRLALPLNSCADCLQTAEFDCPGPRGRTQAPLPKSIDNLY